MLPLINSTIDLIANVPKGQSLKIKATGCSLEERRWVLDHQNTMQTYQIHTTSAILLLASVLLMVKCIF